MTLSKANIQFVERVLIWRSYITAKTLLIIKYIKLINKKKFAKIILDKKLKTFVVYIATLKTLEIIIYLLQKTQIISNNLVQIAVLKQNKVFIKISIKYSDFLNIFLEKKALVLLEQTEHNEHAIKLKNSKQLFYKLIYSLRPIELENLKIYIKIYLETRFNWLFKSLRGALILFDKKPDNSFYLYINY